MSSKIEDNKEREILKKYTNIDPFADLSKGNPRNKIILLTRPGVNHYNTLMSVKNDIGGFSTDFPKSVFKNGGKRKTKQKGKTKKGRKTKRRKTRREK